jgi:hypothetical protein
MTEVRTPTRMLDLVDSSAELARLDPLFMPAPRAPSFLCFIAAGLLPRELLLAPEGEDGAGGGGGGSDGAAEKKFSQTDVDRIVQDRVKGLKGEIEASKTKLGEIDEIKKRLAESDERETKAREEAELKGKSEVEKLQIQVTKANDALKAKDAEWQKRYVDVETLKTQAEQRFVEHVKRSAVSDALMSAGLLKTAGRDATLSFLTEAQIELDEHHQIKTITVGGKSFDKPAEAAKHFLTEKPYYAEPKEGGAGSPRRGGGGGNNALPGSVSGLLSQGLSEMGNSGQ